jgi:hypothetical protein
LSRIYRVLRKAYARAPFDGEGAFRYGGRWSSPGTRLSYASEHQSLAMLEYFVHLDPDDPPADLVLAVAEIPDDLTREKIDPSHLPRNWRDSAAPPELARFGDEFAQRGEPVARWVLDHWEDNATLSSSMGLNVHGWVDDQYWFSRGGMVFQANLQNPVLTYLRRHEIPAAIRNLYNDFVACYYPDVDAFTEEYHQWVHGSGPPLEGF